MIPLPFWNLQQLITHSSYYVKSIRMAYDFTEILSNKAVCFTDYSLMAVNTTSEFHTPGKV